MADLAPMLVGITFFLTVGAVWRAHIISRRMQENARLWTDLQGKVIDRFGSAPEVVRYLESAAGQKMLEGQATSPASPQARILDSLHLGLLILVGGLGLVIAGPTVGGEVREVLQTIGLVAAMLGLGYLASAALSWLLLRRWGLMPSGASDASEDAGA